MEQQDLSSLVAELAPSGRITAEDVLRLRRNIYGARLVIPAHIEALFELDRACSSKVPEWTDLFAEALASYLVEQQEPYGYVDEAKADWPLVAHENGLKRLLRPRNAECNTEAGGAR